MATNVVSGSIVLTLLLLFRTHFVRTLKSNDISLFQPTSGVEISDSPATDCPVLPPCRCVQSPRPAVQGPPSRVRVMCDPAATNRRRVLRFSKTALANRTVSHLSFAYAGLNALPPDTFRHIKVNYDIYSL